MQKILSGVQESLISLSFYTRNVGHLNSICSCPYWFVSYLFGNSHTENRFSQGLAKMRIAVLFVDILYEKEIIKTVS